MPDFTPTIALPVHGAIDYSELARLGLAPDDVLDFSVNSNPYGPSPYARKALNEVALDRYPDRDCLALRQAILQRELPATALSLDSVVCGNGTSELIWTLARACFTAGQKAAIIGPTFGEYAAACHAVGGQVIEWRAERAANFVPDSAALAHWILSERPAIVWLCNPNNPTGVFLDRLSLRAIADACAACNAWLVVDEAYIHFVFSSTIDIHSAIDILHTDVGARLLILRSLTKDYALAGVRLGYVVARPEVIQRIRGQLSSWNVSGLAQAIGCAVLADRTHFTTSMASLKAERYAFFQVVEQAGIHRTPSSTQYCLLEVGAAVRVRQALLLKRLLVRDCTSFGLPEYIRVSTRPEQDWRLLIDALQEVCL